MRKSGNEFRRAIITTRSDGAIPGLMVQSQEPKLDQTRAGVAVSGTPCIRLCKRNGHGGRVLHHLKLRLPDPKTTVLFVGFQADGTRGRTLQSGKTEIKMLGEMVPIRAKVKTIDGFSAHADQQEILRWLGSFKKPPTKTFVIHGEPAASEALATLLRENLKWNTEVPRNGAAVVLS